MFLAHDTKLQRPVALKIVDDTGDDSASARARVLREARNAAALNHPNICTIHEVGDSGETAFIAMEFIEGRSLRDRLDEGPLAADDVVRLGIQAADALAFAHEHGIVHRDFKAANVIVTPDGRLKVVDFGLARREDNLATGATTIATAVPAGAAAGTPYAMAPGADSRPPHRCAHGHLGARRAAPRDGVGRQAVSRCHSTGVVRVDPHRRPVSAASLGARRDSQRRRALPREVA